MLLILIYHYALKIEQLSLAFDNYEDNFLHVCIEIIQALEKKQISNLNFFILLMGMEVA